jgi:NADH-quinone oxidoreductase subunit A
MNSVALEKFFTSAAPLGGNPQGHTVNGWLAILTMLGLGVGFSVASLALSRVIGPRNPTPEKLAPYECGMPPVGDAHERQSVKFYLVAMIFLLFDIEVAFLYPWAMALRDLGWTGYIQIVLFLAILFVGYVYIWRKGVLDWGREAR